MNLYFQNKNPQDKPAADIRKNYEEIVRENAAFEEYYKVSFIFIYICLTIFTTLSIMKLTLQHLKMLI